MLAAFAEGWRRANPAANLDLAVMSAGALDLLDTVEAAHGGARQVMAAADPLGRGEVPAVVLFAAGTVYLQASDVLAETSAGIDLVAAARQGTSYGIGQLIDEALAQGAHRIVVGAGDAHSLDLGLGAVRALAGEPFAVFDPSETGQAPALLREARSRVRGVELVLVASEPITVRGLRGAASRLRSVLGDIETQRLDARLAPLVQVLSREAASLRTTLLSPPPQVASTPGSGAGGGLGVAIEALGGRVVSGPRYLAAEIGLPGRAQQADLAVVLGERIDPVEADTGVIGAVAAAAARHGVAVLALGREGHLDRRAGAPHGISATGSLGGTLKSIEAAGRQHGAAWLW